MDIGDLFDNRLDPPYKVNEVKLKSYRKGIEYLKDFADLTGNPFKYDNPDIAMSEHNAFVDFENDDFEKSEMQALGNALTRFDGCMFTGDSEGNVSLQLIVYDAYTKA